MDESERESVLNHVLNRLKCVRMYVSIRESEMEREKASRGVCAI